MPSADVEFASFYRAELPGQVRRAFLMLGDNEQANDVVNEAMVAVYRNWAKLDTPGAYLNRAVLNGCQAEVDLWHVYHVALANAERALLGDRVDDYDELTRQRVELIALAEQILAERGIEVPSLD